MGPLCGGSIWECPQERSRLRLLQRCRPQWRSGLACCPALESQQHSEDLQRDPDTRSVSEWLCCLMRLCVNCTHPRCCSSACTAPGCCSTPGYCSRCCPNWARLTTSPVTMEMHKQKLLSVTLIVL